MPTAVHVFLCTLQRCDPCRREAWKTIAAEAGIKVVDSDDDDDVEFLG